MRIRILFAVAVTATMLASGCSRESRVESASEAAQAERAAADTAASPAIAAGTAPAEPVPAARLDSAALVDDGSHRFIRTADVQLRVRDVYRTALVLEDRTVASGGYVAHNEIGEEIERVETRPNGDGRLVELTTYRVRGTLTLRIPGEALQGFLRSLADQSEVLEHRRFEARDAQLDLLRQQLARRRHQGTTAQLDRQSARPGNRADATDAALVRNASQTAYDEALLAQKEFEDRIKLATVTIALHQTPQVRRNERMDVEAVARAQGPDFTTRVSHAMATGWRLLLSALVVMAGLWPVWVLLAAAIAARGLWRRHSKARTGAS